MMETRQDQRVNRRKTPWNIRCRVIWGLVCCGFILVVGTAVLLLVGCVTLFRVRRFYAEVFVKWMARAGLWCCGVRVIVDRPFDWPTDQTVYISNHTSSLDLFVLISLGLPNTRYFLSGFLRKIVPLGIIGYVLGVFWTAPQSKPEMRTALFQRAEKTLRRTGESVFLTPEGQKIGRFNKGAFHLATNLSASIQPIYVDIPLDVDPGPWVGNQNLDLRPGIVNVYFKPSIDTTQWKIQDLESNRDSIRDFYADWASELGRGSRGG
jgi:1-acyl-sn-glycerol-3-phosphate acyltransferase